MSKYETPSMPLVQARLRGGKQRPTAIIIRPSFTNSREGAALAVAQVWHRASSFWDAGHYTVDEHKRFRCVDDKVIAGKVDTDKGAIRIAVCAEPNDRDVFWNAVEHGPVLEVTARLVAQLTLAHNINVTYLTDETKARWEKFRTRRRGGIYVTETSGWPAEVFEQKVHYYRTMNTHI